MRHVVLVLEDNAADQALARTLLEGAGWEVYCASNAALSFELVKRWLGGSRELPDTRIVILFDLIMDLHGMHLAAIIRDEQRCGQLRPAALVALTARYTSENRHFSLLAGCDALIQKPLTRSHVGQLAQIEPSLQSELLNAEDEWLRTWLIEEGRRLLNLKSSALRLNSYVWNTDEAGTLLKVLSGKGHQPSNGNAGPLIARFGGFEQARTHLATLVPLLDSPYDSLLSQLLAGASISESGQQLGYGRSQSYVLFHRLSERISQLLAWPGDVPDSAQDRELITTL